MSFAIDGRNIGSGHPCYIIAEGCDNHLGDTKAALEMVRQAKLAGADAIKFQRLRLDGQKAWVTMLKVFNDLSPQIVNGLNFALETAMHWLARRENTPSGA